MPYPPLWHSDPWYSRSSLSGFPLRAVPVCTDYWWHKQQCCYYKVGHTISAQTLVHLTLSRNIVCHCEIFTSSYWLGWFLYYVLNQWAPPSINTLSLSMTLCIQIKMSSINVLFFCVSSLPFIVGLSFQVCWWELLKCPRAHGRQNALFLQPKPPPSSA